MLELIRVIAPNPQTPVQHTLTLPYERRSVSRQRVMLDDGTEAGLLLPRGVTLQDGSLLQAENGVVVRVHAAAETVSTLVCTDVLALARACYHLGNRHVPLEISLHRLCYLHDPVLDEMLHGLGLHVTVTQAPFEPEAGAYGGKPTAHHHHPHG